MTAVSHSSLECALTGFGSGAVLWSSRVYNVAWRRERARSLAFYVFAVLMIEQTESGNQSQNISTPLPLVSLPPAPLTCAQGDPVCVQDCMSQAQQDDTHHDRQDGDQSPEHRLAEKKHANQGRQEDAAPTLDGSDVHRRDVRHRLIL